MCDLYNNATGWHRNQAGSSAVVLQLATNAFNVLYAPSSAPDPISAFTTLFSMDSGGKSTFSGDIAVYSPNKAIFFTDSSHYLQHNGASVLLWTHNFQANEAVVGRFELRTWLAIRFQVSR